MGVFEIFKDGAGKMIYTEVEEICFDTHGSWVPARFAIRVAVLADFLAMSDDDEITLSPDCPKRASYLVPLKPSYKVSEVDSLVVFDEWSEPKTLAIALYESDSDGKLALVRTYPMAEDIPQRFWEIQYPSACTRIVVKLQEFFMLHNDMHSLWYFIGKNTGTLYIVNQDDETVMAYDDFCGIKTGNDVRELGASDGLKVEEFREIGNVYGLKLDALEVTKYSVRELDMPEGVMALAHSNANIEAILSRVLTEEEMNLL